MQDLEQFKQTLRGRGLKATPQRLAVHEAMMSLGHASADGVVAYMEQNNINGITVASVYNTLTLLADCGVYHRLLSSNNKMYFDVTGTCHAHLYDTVNNEYKDIMDDELTALVESHMKGRRFRGYKLDGVNIQLICHPTKKKA